MTFILASKGPKLPREFELSRQTDFLGGVFGRLKNPGYLAQIVGTSVHMGEVFWSSSHLIVADNNNHCI